MTTIHTMATLIEYAKFVMLVEYYKEPAVDTWAELDRLAATLRAKVTRTEPVVRDFSG